MKYKHPPIQKWVFCPFNPLRNQPFRSLVRQGTNDRLREKFIRDENAHSDEYGKLDGVVTNSALLSINLQKLSVRRLPSGVMFGGPCD